MKVPVCVNGQLGRGGLFRVPHLPLNQVLHRAIQTHSRARTGRDPTGQVADPTSDSPPAPGDKLRLGEKGC